MDKVAGGSCQIAARLLLVYAKARREDLSADEKKTVRKLAALLEK